MRNGYIAIYSWLTMVFILGCSTTSNERCKDIDRKVFELSGTVQTVEKKIDDLSRAVSLIVNDGNGLHNEIDSVKNGYGDIQQKIEEVEILVRNLGEHLDKLETSCKTMEEGFNKQMDEIQKAEIELSNRLEVMRLGIKDKQETPATP